MSTVNLTYGTVRTDLHELPVAVSNRIQREVSDKLKSIHPGLPSVLVANAQVAGVTLYAVERLWWNSEDGQRVHLDHATAIPPLARTLLDAVFTVVMLFDAPLTNVRWYHASGWREITDLHRSLTARHGDDPAWTNWLAGHERWVNDLQVDVSPDELANPKRLLWWPNPGKMTGFKPDHKTPYIASVVRRNFLTHLNDRFYRALSGDSHLSYLGVLRRAGALVERDGRSEFLQQYSSNAFLVTVTLFLALLSELIVETALPFEARRIARIWEHLSPWPDADELYKMRYQALLAATAG